MIEGMVASFVQLADDRRAAKESYCGEDADDDLRHQQVMLLENFRKLAGQDHARTLIKKCYPEAQHRCGSLRW